MNDENRIDGHKLDCHVDRVAEWKYKGDTKPVYVEVSPTAVCNHACIFCALDYANHKKVSIPDSDLLRICVDMAHNGVRGIMFGGEGEPTLHSFLPETIRQTVDAGADCALTTNGAGLSREFAERGGNALKWVKVSMNGGDAVTYAVCHGTAKDEFARTWSRIADFRNKAPDVRIGVQAVMLKQNWTSLPDLCRVAASAGLDYVVIKPYSAQKYALHNSALVDYKNTIREIFKLCRKWETAKTKVIIRERAFEKVAKPQECYKQCLSVPYFWAYVSSDMRLVACSNHLPDPRFTIGSLKSTGFRELWYSHNSLKREEIKQMMRTFDVQECRKACRMDAVNEWLWKIQNPGEHVNFI